MGNKDTGWIKTKDFSDPDIDSLIITLKSTSIFDKDRWVDLARRLKKSGMMEKAEIAYVGSRYTDMDDRDLMREWLAIYTRNRIDDKSKSRILEEANMIEEGMRDVLVDTDRLLDELHHVLWMVVNVGEEE